MVRRIEVHRHRARLPSNYENAARRDRPAAAGEVDLVVPVLRQLRKAGHRQGHRPVARLVGVLDHEGCECARCVRRADQLQRVRACETVAAIARCEAGGEDDGKHRDRRRE